MSDETLLRARLRTATRSYPATVNGLATDTGLSPERVEALLVVVGARRHPLRDRAPRTIHTAPVRWSRGLLWE